MNKKYNNKYNECCKPEPQWRVASPGCSQDDSAVACLPDDWIPQHSGDVLKDYLNKRKHDHDQVLKEMFTDAKKLNRKIDDRIKTISEILYAYIEKYRTDNTSTLEEAKACKIRINNDKLQDMLRELQEKYDSILEDIHYYKKEALSIERERAEEIKILLRNYLQKVIKIAEHTPRDLMEIFDRHMFEANQQLLSNTRTYEELVSQLIVQAYNDLSHAKYCVDQLSLGYPLKGLRNEEMAPIDKSTTPNNSENVSLIYEDNMTADEFNECLQKMLNAYHNAVFTVFTGFYNKFIALERNMGTDDISILQKVSCDEEISELEELVTRVLHIINTDTWLMRSRKDVTGIQKSLLKLAEYLKETYSILHEAGHLFDPHIMRTALAQKLHSAGVEDLIINNDIIELSQEVTFNVALEQMRNSPDKHKLFTYYDSIIIMLQKVANQYMDHSEAEVNAIGKYMMVPKIQGDVLESEIKCFLQRHPRVFSVNVSDTSGVFPSLSGVITTSDIEAALPKIFLQTELQATSLLNWKNGFLESFETFLSVLQGELDTHAMKWVEQRESSLNLRYSMKMISHSIRKERIDATKEIRLEEINIHEQRLANHQRALENFIYEALRTCSSRFSLSSPDLFPFEQWMAHIEPLIEAANSPAVDPDVKMLKFRSYNMRLNMYKQLFVDSLHKAVDNYIITLGNEMQMAHIANHQFLSNIKLFNEGGSYSAHEALLVSTTLTKAGERIESTFNKCKDILTAQRAQLLVDAETRVRNAFGNIKLPAVAKPEKKKK